MQRFLDRIGPWPGIGRAFGSAFGFWSALVLGVLLAPQLACEEKKPPEETAASKAVVSADLAATALYDLPAEDWWQPPEVEAKSGALNTTLRVGYADHLVRDHTGRAVQLRLRSYNGMLMGPTLRAKAGDTLRVQLRNDLPRNPDAHADPEAAAAAHHAAMAACPNVPHDFNTTNLHTHGLHISPKKPADDVLLSIEPGESFNYVFPILPAGNPGPEPAEHYPGTFWYHAHRHGSTAMQLASGMAGALILTGDVDEVPEIKSAHERLFLLQQIAYDREGRIEDFGALNTNWNEVVAKHTRVNGRLKPSFVMRPGQIERWRLIDGGVFADVPFEVVPATTGQRPFQLFQIAADGITFPAPRPVSEVEMSPGYRVDLLALAPTQEGVYYLRKKASQYDFTAFGPGGEKQSDPAGPQILAEIVVKGEVCRRNEAGCGSGIPARLPAPVRMLPDITDDEIKDPPKTITFSVDGSTSPPKFMIEGKCFDPDVTLPKLQLKRGDVEEWILVNTSSGPHPFHIHVNAFQVLEAGKPKVWKDTVIIPPNGRVRVRSRFERFDGLFVTHCHILTHEDLGMMQTVEIR